MSFIPSLLVSLISALTSSGRSVGSLPSVPLASASTHLADRAAAFELPAGETVLWAGHEVIRGQKKVPVLGKLKTRTETYSLAKVRPDPAIPGGFIVEASACQVNIKKVAGVAVRVNGPKLPSSTVRMAPNGNQFTGVGSVAWGAQDVDKDGHPGAAVEVDSMLCGGTLHVANDSRIVMRAEHASPAGMTGAVSVRVSQSILEAEGRCLSNMAKDEKANSNGRFAYARVPSGSTCASLMNRGWPVRAK